MNRLTLFPSFPLTVKRAALAMLLVIGLGACGGNPNQPANQTPTAPPVDPLRVTCPMAVSLTSPTGQPTPVRYGSATTAGGTPPIQVTCTPASDSVFNTGATTVTCTATDSRNVTDSCTFIVTVNVPPKISVDRFLAFGDSLTWGEDGSSSSFLGYDLAANLQLAVQFPSGDTYPGALQTQLGARYTLQTPSVTNAGLKAERVLDSGTLSRFVGFTSSGQFGAVLLMEGANDLVDRDARIEPAVIDGLRRMIGDAKSRGLRVFFATLPPQNPNGCCPNRGLSWSLVPGFNDQIRQLASSDGVTLVDVYQAFNDNLSLIGADGLHPTAAGYHKIADTFFASIKQLLEVASPSNPTALLYIQPRR